MERDRYTLTYRAAEAQQVMGWIKAGQSGCVVALRGGGKSKNLRFLLQEEIRQHYRGQDYQDFLFVLIDLLVLIECTEWAACELVLDRLLNQLPALGVDEDLIKKATSLQHEVIHSRDLLSAHRPLEQCVDILCQRQAQRLALCFSDFDHVFHTLDPPLFHRLRAIRHTHKEQVSYIVAVTNDLDNLRDNLAEVEPFYQLVSRNICWLGPFRKPDSQHMIHYLTRDQPAKLNARDTARLVELSGAHPGPIKTILSQLWDAHPKQGLSELAPTLKDEPKVQAECRKVWESLSKAEQVALCALASRARANQDTLHSPNTSSPSAARDINSSNKAPTGFHRNVQIYRDWLSIWQQNQRTTQINER